MTTATSNCIAKTPGVCGGRACIRGHCIPVWALVPYRQLELSNAEILEAYPSIAAADLDAAWDNNASNRQEIDRDIQENEVDESPKE